MEIENRSRYACVFEAIVKGATLTKAGRQCDVGPAWRVRRIVFKLWRMMRKLRTRDEPLPHDEFSLVEFRRNREFLLRQMEALQQEWRDGVDRTKTARSVEHDPKEFGKSGGSVDTLGLTVRATQRLANANPGAGEIPKVPRITLFLYN